MNNAMLKSALRVLALLGLVVSVSAYAVSDKQRAAIAERLKPHGQVCLEGDSGCGNAVAAAATSGAPKSASEIYDQYCTACHPAGIAGAPKPGDASIWDARVAAGIEEVYTHAINGYNAMPPRGTCMSCSDEEIQATVDLMIEGG